MDQVNTQPDHALQADVAAIGRVDAVPMILDVICRTTGMGFAAVTRVTRERWIAGAVLDKIAFGLAVGGELKIETTICDEIRASGEMVAIDHVAEDERYRAHHTPLMYGLQSYISVPIYRRNTEFFGTLCAVDPNPAKVQTAEIIGMFKLFAQLIGAHLDDQERLQKSEEALLSAQQAAQLREQFIAILSHDLRNPLNAISMGAKLLQRQPAEAMPRTIARIDNSVHRMQSLIDNMLDFSRARLGGGFVLDRSGNNRLQQDLEHVVAELRAIWPDRGIVTRFAVDAPVLCDSARLSQMLSNLLANAITHGKPDGAIMVTAATHEEDFVLSVANQGKPITQEEMERLFQPFVRGAHDNKDSGLGLGLYIASEIARAHEGVLSVASDAQGTVFSFRMPRQAASGPGAAAA